LRSVKCFANRLVYKQTKVKINSIEATVMSVTPNQIVLYGSANMPEADGVTVGGAVDFTKRVSFYDVPAAPRTMGLLLAVRPEIMASVQGRSLMAPTAAGPVLAQPMPAGLVRQAGLMAAAAAARTIALPEMREVPVALRSSLLRRKV
jgi:hypothetical protein